MAGAGGMRYRPGAWFTPRVATDVDLVAWAWTWGYISDAQYQRLVTALARGIADRIAPRRGGDDHAGAG